MPLDEFIPPNGITAHCVLLHPRAQQCGPDAWGCRRVAPPKTGMSDMGLIFEKKRVYYLIPDLHANHVSELFPQVLPARFCRMRRRRDAADFGFSWILSSVVRAEVS